jgi:hypothetical protein
MQHYEDFHQSLSGQAPPPQLSPLLTALWHDKKGDWHTAHELAQDVNTREGSWIHAYLHRKEGDTGNASYWYHRAGRSMPTHSLDAEWEVIVRELLQHS